MNLSATPPAVQQIIENLLDDSTPGHIRGNYLLMLNNIMACCSKAVEEHHKKQAIRKKG